MVEDISRSTIFVLVVLTLLVSILGTWTVLSHVSVGPTSQVSQSKPTDTGRIQLTITEPAVPLSTQVTGNAVFTILER